jgi:hypothetical protein
MGPHRQIDSDRSSPPNEVPKEKLGIVELSIHTAIRSNDAFPNERSPPQSILSLCSARVATAALYLAAVLMLCLPESGLAFNFPSLTGRVVDQAGIMTAQSRSELEAKLKDLEDKSGVQVVVATVKSLEGSDIETFANQLFRNWRLGETKKNSVNSSLANEGGSSARTRGLGCQSVVSPLSTLTMPSMPRSIPPIKSLALKRGTMALEMMTDDSASVSVPSRP